MHNLGTVFRFEVIRTLKKKSFWIMALAFPAVIGIIFGIVFFSNKATDQAAEDTKNQKFSIAITDDSGLVNKRMLQSIGGSEMSDKEAAIEKVKSGALDAYFYYPKDLTHHRVEIYGKDVGLFNNGRYDGIAKVILQQSVLPAVNPQAIAILQDKVAYSDTTYKDGAPYDGFKELLAPGIFLILFYFLLAMFGNQMLTSTTEEKENRVIEMILTTIEARSLIIGKILSLIVLAAIQICIILVPIIIGYVFFHDQLQLPNLDLTHIPLNAGRISIGAAVFACSFLMFTGLLVAIGAATPTAKEAGGFFGIAMAFTFGPLYAAPLFISAPDSMLVKALSFFPLTGPIPLLLRNAVGNLSVGEAIIGILILAVSAVLALLIAVRLFRYGALEYSRRLSLGVLFQNKRSS
jgi:ABC-2 type transport system permease protein